MDPHYLIMTTQGLEAITLFAIAPAIAIVIAYNSWREKNLNTKKSLLQCVVSIAVALSLLVYWQGRGGDVGRVQFFLQWASALLSFLLLGVFMGCGFAVMLGAWRCHNATRLKSHE